MIIDLHIHSKNGSDGRWDVRDIFAEASKRNIGLISISDHDSIAAQEAARELAGVYGMRYVTGIELNVTFSHPQCLSGKDISLDFLGYGFDIGNKALLQRLEELRAYRLQRAVKIFENLNGEFRRQGIPELTVQDTENILASAGSALARPHIAAYLAAKGIVADKQEAFERFLVKCDVPKLPLRLDEASELIRSAGGRIVLAHPGDPKGTSLVTADADVTAHPDIIRKTMLGLIDGVECWHTRLNRRATRTYLKLVKAEGLIATGGSDCHQQPTIMGRVSVPDWVAGQFA